MPSETVNSPFYPVTAALTSVVTASDWLPASGKGAIGVHVYGTFTGTWWIEASRDDGKTAAAIVKVLNADGSATLFTTPGVIQLATPLPDFRYRVAGTIVAGGTANVFMRQSRETA